MEACNCLAILADHTSNLDEVELGLLSSRVVKHLQDAAKDKVLKLQNAATQALAKWLPFANANPSPGQDSRPQSPQRPLSAQGRASHSQEPNPPAGKVPNFITITNVHAEGFTIQLAQESASST
jgi:hypothetical protein